jgi:tRNA(fMet)-specific endonuclease VapC
MNERYLLDTNVPSETLRPFPDTTVISWLDSHTIEGQFLSVVTIGELRKGIALLAPGARRSKLEYFIEVKVPAWFPGRILPVTQTIAERWGALDAARQQAGRHISTTDGMIAATALEHGLTLVTRNVKDFTGLGIELLNPWELF